VFQDIFEKKGIWMNYLNLKYVEFDVSREFGEKKQQAPLAPRCWYSKPCNRFMKEFPRLKCRVRPFGSFQTFSV
jgi:hypothetical protein